MEIMNDSLARGGGQVSSATSVKWFCADHGTWTQTRRDQADASLQLNTQDIHLCAPQSIDGWRCHGGSHDSGRSLARGGDQVSSATSVKWFCADHGTWTQTRRDQADASLQLNTQDIHLCAPQSIDGWRCHGGSHDSGRMGSPGRVLTAHRHCREDWQVDLSPCGIGGAHEAQT